MNDLVAAAGMRLIDRFMTPGSQESNITADDVQAAIAHEQAREHWWRKAKWPVAVAVASLTAASVYLASRIGSRIKKGS